MTEYPIGSTRAQEQGWTMSAKNQFKRFVSPSKVILGTILGYATYSAGMQIYTANILKHRRLASDEKYADPAIRFAPIKILGRYVNPFQEYRHQTLFEFLYCRLREIVSPKPRDGPFNADSASALLACMKPCFEDAAKWWQPLLRRSIAFTWLGQTCAVVQFLHFRKSPINILTDPMFKDHVVSSRFGPQRLSARPCEVGDLPKLDAVLVSHDHQDHLDLDAARSIGDSTIWVVPKGVGKHLRRVGVTKIVEMGWWEKIPFPGVDQKLGYEIACTPAMHWSGRAMIDANMTLWCSFLVLRHSKPVFYHAGDSGYSLDLYRSIYEKYGGGCRLAMIPCGAYTPRWHLRSQHMCPKEALYALADLQAKQMVAVHWGTFIMSDESVLEPPTILSATAKRLQITHQVAISRLGQTAFYR